MSARWLTLLAVLAAQASLGATIGYFLGGVPPAALLALVAAVASIAVSAGARRTGARAFRQLLLAACLLGLHLAALYTLGDDGIAPLVSANAQLVLAGLGLAACAWFAARLPPPPDLGARVEHRSRFVDDDPTIEIDAAAAAEGTSPVTSPTPRLRHPFALGLLSAALLVAAAIFWLGDDAPADMMAVADARERSAPAAAAPAMPPLAMASAAVAGDDAPATAAADASDMGPAVEASAPDTLASGSAAAGNAVAPSAARRECMAQIESAHLFLQSARQSTTQEQYDQATQAQIARMLTVKPVGPRTLNRIAERMWEAREAQQRSSAWWASQFSRCEAARSSGSWYVVRG